MTTGTVSSGNLTSLYSNTTSFTAGVVNSSVYSVNGGTGVTVNPTTGNVVVSIGQAVGTSSNVTFANVTATGNLSNNYYTLANAVGTNGQVLTTNGAGNTAWTTVSSLGLVNSVSGSGAGISVSPTTGAVVVSNTGVTSIVAGTNITVSSATGAVTINSTSANGDVVGPAGATANALARYDGVTGKLIKNSTVTLSDSGNILSTTAGTLYINGAVTSPGGTQTYIGNDADVLEYGYSSPTNNLLYTDHFIRGNLANRIYNTSATGSTYPLRIEAEPGTAITPGVGYGVGMLAGLYDNTGTLSYGGRTTWNWTDATAGTEDCTLNFELKQAGALTNVASLTSTGNLQIDGDLTVTGENISTGVTNSIIEIDRTSTGTNSFARAAILKSTSTGTPTTGFGTALGFIGQTDATTFKDAGYIAVTSSDVTTGSEDFTMSFGLMAAGAAYSSKMDLDSLGNLQIDGDLTVSGTNINTGVTNTVIEIDRTTTNTNSPARALVLETISTGTPAVGLGTALGFNSQTATSTFIDSAFVRTRSTDITPGSETFDMDFGLVNAGAAVATKATLYGNGDFETVGNLIVPGITIDNRASIDTSTLTTTSTSTVALATSTRNVMSVLVNIIQGTNVHCVNATVLKTGASTAMVTTYGEMYNTSSLASFTADTSGGSIRLLITPTSATSTVFSAVNTALT